MLRFLLGFNGNRNTKKISGKIKIYHLNSIWKKRMKKIEIKISIFSIDKNEQINVHDYYVMDVIDSNGISE